MSGANGRLQPVPLRVYPTMGRRGSIYGVGSYVPERVVTNAEMESLVDTSDQWIVERTGIRQRRFAPAGTASAELGLKAAQMALRNANISPAQIDLILVASASPDAPFPAMACRIQEGLGATGACAFDLLAACTGFLYALSVADAHIAANRANYVLVVGAEVLSRIIDWADRGTCVLLGDAAGAVVLGPADEGKGFLSWCTGADGIGWDLLTYGDSAEVGAWASREEKPYFRMKGREVFRFAIDNFVRQATGVLQAAGLGLDQLDLFVPHQANRRIIEAAASRLGLPLERVVINIDRYGNTSTATIPLALDEALGGGRIHRGDKVLLASFGAGVTWAACVLEWDGGPGVRDPDPKG